MWLQAAVLVPPVAGVALAHLLPSVFFPPAPKCSSESPELLQHCQRMSQRFISCALVATAAVWMVATFIAPVVRLDDVSIAGRLGFALRLESASLLLYVFAILRVAVRRGSDEKAVMGQRSGASS